MVAFIVLLGIIFGGVKLLAVANNISDNEAMDKYSEKTILSIASLSLILLATANSLTPPNIIPRRTINATIIIIYLSLTIR